MSPGDIGAGKSDSAKLLCVSRKFAGGVCQLCRKHGGALKHGNQRARGENPTYGARPLLSIIIILHPRHVSPCSRSAGLRLQWKAEQL